MISFKQYLNEVIAIDWGSKDNAGSFLPDDGGKITKARFAEIEKGFYLKLIGGLDSFDFYVNEDGFHKGKRIYVYDKIQKRFTMFLRVKEPIKPNKKVLKIDIIYSSSFNKLKAYDFYHKLIQDGYVLFTNMQSEGGQLIWSKLYKFKDVNIHGWYRGKAVNVDLNKDNDEIYIDMHDYGNDPVNSGSIDLVAHKK